MTTKDKIEIMQAYLDGKTIEMRSKQGSPEWTNFNINDKFAVDPDWNWQVFEYQIKSEPKDRAYNSIEEILKAIKEHGPLLRARKEKNYYNIEYINPKSIHIVKRGWMSFAYLLNNFVWQDGATCGILE